MADCDTIDVEEPGELVPARPVHRFEASDALAGAVFALAVAGFLRDPNAIDLFASLFAGLWLLYRWGTARQNTRYEVMTDGAE